MSWIGPAISVAGGLLGGQSAADAARSNAQATTEAARIAADAAKFRPVGVTTRYGSSNFQFDPNTGYLTGAGYNVSPEMKAYQDRISAIQGNQLTDVEQAQQRYSPLTNAASSLFNIGGEGLKSTPEQMASDWMKKQMAVLAPSREQAWSNLNNQLQNTGRTGLSIAQGGGLMAANPEASALANAQTMADLNLAAQATQEGRNATNFYGNLFGQGGNLLNQYSTGQAGAYDPFSTSMNVSSGIENLGIQPLTIGSELGGRTANAGANSGQFITQGARNAAGYNYQANSYNPWADALTAAGTNPNLRRMFSGGGTTSQWTPSQFQDYQTSQYGYGNTNSQGGFDFGTGSYPP
jgi:hypothetical protein